MVKRSIAYFSTLFLLNFLIIGIISCSKTNSDNSTPGHTDPSLSELYPVDGIVDFSTLSNVKDYTITLRNIADQVVYTTIPVRIAFVNDDRELYIAVEWTDESFDDQYTSSGPVACDEIFLMIDNNGDGIFQDDEDQKIIVSELNSAQYLDSRKTPVDPAEYDDLIGDGNGYMKYYPGEKKYKAEFIIPLTSTDTDDKNITPSSRFNVMIVNHMFSTPTHAGYIFEGEWSKIPLTAAGPLSHLSIPGDLQGQIVLISRHEDEKGKIYKFNPQTKAVTRLTCTDSDPLKVAEFESLYIDNISLSHDRSRVAFMGSTTPMFTTNNVDIYMIKLDGSDYHRFNSATGFVHGHPGWSPDDSKLVYITFQYGTGHIWVADSDDISTATDLSIETTTNTEENDPDWLTDGRIIFKTSRWTPWYTYPDEFELRIAIMDSDGTNVKQVSFGDDVVDHDPVAKGDSAIFERITAPYDFYSDIRASFVPWDIVEAKLDGSGQRTLVHDPWINWLPVYDPSGQYAAYIRTCGYAELRLIRLSDGKDLGRLLPGITRLQYFDWK
ncbi:MAG: hypothetical protein V1874_03625 [Spirochaetota bacterium]